MKDTDGLSSVLAQMKKDSDESLSTLKEMNSADELKKEIEEYSGVNVEQSRKMLDIFNSTKSMLSSDSFEEKELAKSNMDDLKALLDTSKSVSEEEAKREELAQIHKQTALLGSINTGFESLSDTLSNIDDGLDQVGIVGGIGALIFAFLKPQEFAATLSKYFTSIFDSIKGIVKIFTGDFQSGWSLLRDNLTEFGLTFGLLAFKFRDMLMVPLKMVASMFKPLQQMFSALKGTFGTLLKKIFFPITIVLGIIDGFNGFIDGWAREAGSGSILDQFVSGVSGALGGVVSGIIGSILDLLKDGTSWVISKLGFDEASEFLDSFSFSEIIKSVFYSLSDGLISAKNSIMDSVTGAIQDMLNIFDSVELADFVSDFSFSTTVSEVLDAMQNNLKAMITSILPDKDSWVGSVLPDSVYEWADKQVTSTQIQPTDVEAAPSQSGFVLSGISEENDLGRNDVTATVATAITNQSTQNTNSSSTTYVMPSSGSYLDSMFNSYKVGLR